MSEGEIRPAGQMHRAGGFMQHLGDEFLGGECREIGVECHLDHMPHAQGCEILGALGGGRQAEWRIVRAEQAARMRLEREHAEPDIRTRRVGGVQQMGVTAMHAVEIAQSEDQSTGILRQIAPVGVQHAGLSSPVGQETPSDLHRFQTRRKT